MKHIEGYHARYSISRDGKVYSTFKNGKTKEIGSTTKGYRVVNLRKLTDNNKYSTKKVSVHRLVALAYIPNLSPESKTQVDHIDGDKLNNNADNLRWCTNEENQNFRIKQNNDGREYGVLGVNNSPIAILFNGVTYSSKNSLAKHLSNERGTTVKCLVKTITNVIKRQGTLYGHELSIV